MCYSFAIGICVMANRLLASVATFAMFSISSGGALAADLCDQYTSQGYRMVGKPISPTLVGIRMLNKEGTECLNPKASYASPSRIPREYPQLAKFKYFSCGGSLIFDDLSGLIDKSNRVWIIERGRNTKTTYKCKEYGSKKVARESTKSLYYTFDEAKNTLRLFYYITVDAYLMEKESLPNL